MHGINGMSLHLQGALELPILLEILLNHLLDGIGTWAEGVSSLTSESFLDKVVEGVFLLISSGCVLDH